MEYISDCDKCGEEMNAEHKFDTEITCSNCGATWILDWDYDKDYKYYVHSKQLKSPRLAEQEWHT